MLPMILSLLMQFPSINADLPEVTPQPSPGSSGFALRFDDAAVSAVQDAQGVSPRRVVVYVDPQRICPPCEAMKADVGEGDADISVEYTKDAPPSNIAIRGYPTVHMPDIDKVWTGRATLKNLRWWHGLPMESPVSMPSLVGSATLGDYGKWLSLVTAGELSGKLPSDVIDVGSGAKFSMAGAEWRMKVNGELKSVTFSGNLPYVSYGIIKASVRGLEYDGKSLTLRLRGLPDWRFTVN